MIYDNELEGEGKRERALPAFLEALDTQEYSQHTACRRHSMHWKNQAF